jgi:phage shock protein A
MDQLEDKELLLKQYLREMETALQKKSERLQRMVDTCSIIKAGHAAAHREIEKLEKDLTLALRKENDDIAKLLIRKQRIQQKHCENQQQQLVTLEEEQKNLAHQIDEQRLKYETLMIKATTFCNRAERSNNNQSMDSSVTSPYTIDEDEIELELMKRKESLAEKGDAT